LDVMLSIVLAFERKTFLLLHMPEGRRRDRHASDYIFSSMHWPDNKPSE